MKDDLMKNIATAEMADKSRAAYRKRCTHKRKGAAVYQKRNGRWHRVNLDNFEALRVIGRDRIGQPVECNGVNRAKRFILYKVRGQGYLSFTEK